MWEWEGGSGEFVAPTISSEDGARGTNTLHQELQAIFGRGTHTHIYIYIYTNEYVVMLCSMCASVHRF